MRHDLKVKLFFWLFLFNFIQLYVVVSAAKRPPVLPSGSAAMPGPSGPKVAGANSKTFALQNEIIFSSNNESFTSRDMRLYQEEISDLLKSKKLSKFTGSELEDFMLSRSAVREAEIFEMAGDVNVLSSYMKKKLMSEYSVEEIEAENKKINKALAYVELRESMLKTQQRFDDWFLALQRKYQFRRKNSP